MSKVVNIVGTGESKKAISDKEVFARDVRAGLSAQQKHIPAAYHYDTEGSRLFNRITELPEYYLTNSEIEALEVNKNRIADLLSGEPVNLIEFGPADGSKTRTLVDCFIQRKLDFRYVAVDISESALEKLASDYSTCFPELSLDCLAANYYANLNWLKERYSHKNVVLFLGSSIGNFSPPQTHTFLRNLRRNLKTGDMAIIGFDLAKEADLIHRAYNDSEDVTAAFNMNLLTRINRELDGDFDISAYRYKGKYIPDSQVVRSYLISLDEQDVYIGELEHSFYFKRDESIHTEDSYKYRKSDIEKLAVNNGFTVLTHLYDSREYFIDSVWEAC